MSCERCGKPTYGTIWPHYNPARQVDVCEDCYTSELYPGSQWRGRRLEESSLPKAIARFFGFIGVAIAVIVILALWGFWVIVKELL